MNTTRSCGCKGYRSCLICEDQHGIVTTEVGQVRADGFTKTATYCLTCQGTFLSEGTMPGGLHWIWHRSDDTLGSWNRFREIGMDSEYP